MGDMKITCSGCGVVNCYRREGNYPKNCRTANMEEGMLEEAMRLVTEDQVNNRIMKAAAEIEGNYYCKLTRIEEIILFCKKIGVKKVGIAACAGSLKEASTFAKILEVNGLEAVTVACKVGAVDKTEVGVREEDKIAPGCNESMCNPVLQALVLNQEETDLNVISGLCVGHDTLFIKYSKSPTTVLFVKDRVTGHNPAAPLYLTGGYYSKLMQPQNLEEPEKK